MTGTNDIRIIPQVEGWQIVILISLRNPWNRTKETKGSLNME